MRRRKNGLPREEDDAERPRRGGMMTRGFHEVSASPWKVGGAVWSRRREVFTIQ
jgi:hypothetical protein